MVAYRCAFAIVGVNKDILHDHFLMPSINEWSQ